MYGWHHPLCLWGVGQKNSFKRTLRRHKNTILSLKPNSFIDITKGRCSNTPCHISQGRGLLVRQIVVVCSYQTILCEGVTWTTHTAHTRPLSLDRKSRKLGGKLCKWPERIRQAPLPPRQHCPGPEKWGQVNKNPIQNPFSNAYLFGICQDRRTSGTESSYIGLTLVISSLTMCHGPSLVHWQCVIMTLTMLVRNPHQTFTRLDWVLWLFYSGFTHC